MPCKVYTVLVDWHDNDVEDTDEIQVNGAKSALSAISKAKRAWRLTYGAKYPHCRITRIRILTDSLLRQIA